MPIHSEKDEDGKSYYQWGNHGKRYYYNPKNKKSKNDAYEKAVKQAQAAYAHGWREYGHMNDFYFGTKGWFYPIK